MRNTDKRKQSWENRVTRIQSKILEALAKYKFLTIPHMLLCDIGTRDYTYAWKQASSLRDRGKPLASTKDYRSIDAVDKGRRHSIYNLTAEGKKVLVEELDFPVEDIKMPRNGKTISDARYYHRVDQITYEIILDKWAEIKNLEIPFFHRDFDYTGNNRRGERLHALTRIELGNEAFFIPDGAYKLASGDGKEIFHLFEYERGDKTRKALQKIHKHAEAMTFRSTHRKFNLNENKSYRVVFLFETESLKNLVITQAKKDESLSLVGKYFICKSIETMEQDDFFDRWENLQGMQVNFYDF